MHRHLNGTTKVGRINPRLKGGAPSEVVMVACRRQSMYAAQGVWNTMGMVRCRAKKRYFPV